MPEYVKDVPRRPWVVQDGATGNKRELFKKWLLERGGIVVYENQLMDSSQFGDRSYMPARYISVDDRTMDAPMAVRTELASTRQEQTDHVTVEQYLGDVERALDGAFIFKQEEKSCPAPKPKKKSRSRSARKGR